MKAKINDLQWIIQLYERELKTTGNSENMIRMLIHDLEVAREQLRTLEQECDPEVAQES